MGIPFQSLTLEEIQGLHARLIKSSGGLYSEADGNFLNRGSLAYALESCTATIFGEELYKTVFEKIAVIVKTIICNHVFRDGNKRTGTFVAMALLEINGFTLIPDIDDADFAIKIAVENLSIEEIAAWIQRRVSVAGS